MPDSTFNLIKTCQDILDKIGSIASTKYIQDGNGFPVSTHLTSRTGDTRKVLLGGAGSIRKIVQDGDRIVLTYGVQLSALPGMRLLELGGVVSPEQKMFFWSKYRSTRKDTMESVMWFNMARGKTEFKARHTIENSINDAIPEVRNIIKDDTYRFIQTSIRRIIDDTNARNT